MIQLFRIWIWFRNLRCKLADRHGRAPDDGWGWAPGSDIVSLYCGGCGAKYKEVALSTYINRREVIDA